MYRQIEAEGLLSKRRWEVYRHLFKLGPLTQREVTDQVSSKFAAERSYTPRFAELEKMGVIESVGERTCSITGRHVLIWDVTDKLPAKYEAPKTMPRKEVKERMTVYRTALVTIWRDKRTPEWARDIIREQTKQFHKESTS